MTEKKKRDSDQWGLILAIVVIAIGLMIAVFSGEYSLIPDTPPSAPAPTELTP